MAKDRKGEFDLIDDIKTMFPTPEGVLGIGDDCAVIPQRTGIDTLVSTDMLVEGVHFLLSDADPRLIGWKSAAVNISDIAAMGGSVCGTFLSFALPGNLSEGWIEAFLEGYREISGRYACPLLGGDTTASPDRLCINVTVLGTCPSGRAKRRSDARVGDLVCVTGTLGDSAGGLEIIRRGLDRGVPRNATLVERHYRPVPRVEEGLSLAACGGVHAMMDISDGIASDLRHIMAESGVGAEVDLALIPVSDELRSLCECEGLDLWELALAGGEDYELLFTMDASAHPGVPYKVIGRINAGTSLKWIGSGVDYMGFRHF